MTFYANYIYETKTKNFNSYEHCEYEMMLYTKILKDYNYYQQHY